MANITYADKHGTVHTLPPAQMLRPEQRDRIIHLFVVMLTHVQLPDRDTNIPSAQAASDALDEILSILLPAVAQKERTAIGPVDKVTLVIKWREAQPMAAPFTPSAA